jgi:hypothetical protein
MTRMNVVSMAGLLICSLGIGASAAPAFAQLMGRENPEKPGKRQGQASPQQPRRDKVKVATTAGAHLQVVLQLSESGGAEVVKVSELPGAAVLSDAPIGNYVYEVTKGGKTIAAESSVDPFELRSYPPPGNPTQGHHVQRARTALLVVKVPATRLADADLDRLSIRFHRIVGKQRLEAMNPGALAQLQQSGILDKRWEMSGSQLASVLQRKGRTMR